MAQTMMLQFEGEAIPRAIQVSDWAYNRFKYLQNEVLINPKTDDFIIHADENRDWDSLTEAQQSDLIDIWGDALSQISQN